MRQAHRVLWALIFLPLLVFTSSAWSGDEDDYTPEVTARVVRISFIRGNVEVRRTGEDANSDDWERGTMNLPLVEGDEVSTGPDAQVEIQLDSQNHVRLGENSYLKFTTLRDEGVAISLPQGVFAFRSYAFDKDKSYLEIDAPGTTVSIERAGAYRIDAGDTRSSDIRVAASEKGEAKVYTKTSGFTLRSGRSARIAVDGTYAGDYDMSNVASFDDDFEDWVAERDEVVSRRLDNSYYDKYYDRDIYGAEDLNDYGDWIFTNDYGYVWRPSSRSVAGYSNWSPYRYGHWRWIPFYGWTWVNDEPWGWATYHHGRWIWANGGWLWSPYGQTRWRRSWWTPAFVSITTWNGSQICWYPLGWGDRWNDYNYGYRRNRRDRRDRDDRWPNGNGGGGPYPTPTPRTSPTPIINGNPRDPNSKDDRWLRSQKDQRPPLDRIPPTAVITANSDTFGRNTRGNTTAPLDTARRILTVKNDDPGRTPPILPTIEQVRSKKSPDISVERPRVDRKMIEPTKTGAETRETGRSLDKKLEQERIFGNRTPKPRQPDVVTPRDNGSDKRIDNNGGGKRDDNGGRDTGVIIRQPPTRKPVDVEPTRNPDTKTDNGGGQTRRNDDKNVDRTPPIWQQEQTRKREEPRIDRTPPTPRPDTRREEPRKPEPRPEPKPEPRQPPTPKSEPRPEPKPEQRPPMERKKNPDGN